MTSFLCNKVEDSGNFKAIIKFECRGMEPTDFSPRVCILFNFRRAFKYHFLHHDVIVSRCMKTISQQNQVEFWPSKGKAVVIHNPKDHNPMDNIVCMVLMAKSFTCFAKLPKINKNREGHSLSEVR